MDISLEELTGLNSAFGPVAAGACRISLKGDIAVRTDKGYRAFDPETKKLVNVTEFCLDLGNLFYIMPTRKLAVGDIILFDGRFKCVVESLDTTVKALDYGTSVIEELVPETRVFFGRTFYGKVTSLAGNLKGNGKGLIKMSLISKALGGTADSASLLPLMLMGGLDKEDAEGCEGESMMKMFLTAKICSGAGMDGNGLLPLLLLGKGTDGDDLGSIGKLLILTQLSGGQMDLGKIMLFKLLGSGDDAGLFDGLDLFGDKE